MAAESRRRVPPGRRPKRRSSGAGSMPEPVGKTAFASSPIHALKYPIAPVPNWQDTIDSTVCTGQAGDAGRGRANSGSFTCANATDVLPGWFLTRLRAPACGPVELDLEARRVMRKVVALIAGCLFIC